MTHPRLHALHPQFMESYNIIDQNMGLKPQKHIAGDPMPNKPPTQSS